MIGRFCTFENWHTTTQNLTRRGVRIMATLALTFVMVGANPSSSAQAAPDNDGSFTFIMTAVPSAEYVCIGQTMDINVKISRLLDSQPGDTGPKFNDIQGVIPNVKPIDPSIGTIKITGKYFNTKNHHVETTIFTFRASNNPGTTTIQFYADIPKYWDGNVLNYAPDFGYKAKRDLQIDVRNCTYKVLLITTAPVPGIGLWVASPEEIRLQETSSNQFSGTTHWNLIYNDFNTMGCPITGTSTPNNVEYKVHLNGERLYLDYTIDEFTATVTAHCDDPEQGNPPPIIHASPAGTGTVSVPSQGGGIEVPAGLGGSYLFIITRVSDRDPDQ